MGDKEREPMLDLFIYETLQLLEQLEQLILNCEKQSGYESLIGEIFRIMHTIKGSAAMMNFENISILAHSIEDLFFYLRENQPENIDYLKLSDLVLEGVDFIQNEISKIQENQDANGDSSCLIHIIKEHLESLKNANNPSLNNSNLVVEEESMRLPANDTVFLQDSIHLKKPQYRVVLFFEDDCQMEDLRAFTVIHNLKEIAEVIAYTPENLNDHSDETNEIIRREGFQIIFASDCETDEINDFFNQTILLKEFKFNKIEENEDSKGSSKPEKKMVETQSGGTIQPVLEKESDNNNGSAVIKQNLISVNVLKLDYLMDLVAELVITESMVTRNPELAGLPLDNFYKAARQLRKITSELQDVVMTMRMVPLATTFQKMHRIVRDMSHKLSKEVELSIVGQETEVDKNIIEHLTDPLIHLIRNSLDHGIEQPAERIAKGKTAKAKITLEAKNTGGDVWILIKDDGKGLDREKILQKARKNGLLHKAENELTDKEIYSLIFLPGFSTKEEVTEFSGRGVGMDVITKNIEMVGGEVLIDSIPNVGTTVSLKIPLTLAIINGMTVTVGQSRYTIPTTSIKESFRIKGEELVVDPDGNEMILLRGQCHPIVRLHQVFQVKTPITQITDGIIVMVENDGKSLCFFADSLLGEQQVVIKGLPKYINKVRGIAGCTLLGDGNISLIIDTLGFLNNVQRKILNLN